MDLPSIDVSDITILIGRDVMRVHDVLAHRSPPDGIEAPDGILTYFGWSIAGPVPESMLKQQEEPKRIDERQCYEGESSAEHLSERKEWSSTNDAATESAWITAVGAHNSTSKTIEPISKAMATPFEMWLSMCLILCLRSGIVLSASRSILIWLASIVTHSLSNPSNAFIVSFAATVFLIVMVSRPCYHVLISMSYLDLRRYISSVRSSVYNNVCLVLQYAFLLVTIGRISVGKVASEYRAWCAKSKLVRTADISWIIPILLLLFSISGEEQFIGFRVLSVFLVCHRPIHITVIDMQTLSRSTTNKIQASFTLSASGMAGMAAGITGADKQVFRNSHESAAISTSTFSSIGNVLKVTQASTTRNIPTPAISKLFAVANNNPTNEMSRIDDVVNQSENKVNINYAVFGA